MAFKDLATRRAYQASRRDYLRAYERAYRARHRARINAQAKARRDSSPAYRYTVKLYTAKLSDGYIAALLGRRLRDTSPEQREEKRRQLVAVRAWSPMTPDEAAARRRVLYQEYYAMHGRERYFASRDAVLAKAKRKSKSVTKQYVAGLMRIPVAQLEETFYRAKRSIILVRRRLKETA